MRPPGSSRFPALATAILTFSIQEDDEEGLVFSDCETLSHSGGVVFSPIALLIRIVH